MRVIHLFAAGGLLVASATATAATHCINSVSSFQTALTAAAGSAEADELRVQSGTYLLTSPLFYSPSAATELTISGGWDAACDVQVANPEATVIDGQASTTLFGMGSPGVVASLTVFNLTGANGRNSNGGAGLKVITAGDVTLREVILRNNDHSGTLYQGGGANIERARNVLVSDSIFRNNRSVAGAGLSIGSCSEVRVESSRFEGNEHHASGGVLHAGSAVRISRYGDGVIVPCQSVEIVGTQFIDQVEGPVAIESAGQVLLQEIEITGTTFQNRTNIASPAVACGQLNIAPSAGNDAATIVIDGLVADGNNTPAHYCFDLAAASTVGSRSSITVSNSEFSGHTSGVMERLQASDCSLVDSSLLRNTGATAIHTECQTLSFRRNRFVGNRSIAGPAIARPNTFLTSATVADNLFKDNVADHSGDGGALYFPIVCQGFCTIVTNVDIAITGNTFVGNMAGGNGGAVALASSFDTLPALSLENNLFSGNTAQMGSDVYFDNDLDGDFVPTPMTVEHNGFAAAGSFSMRLPAAPLSGTNLVIADPLFADPETEDYRLSTTSPARDVGSASARRMGTTDLDGTARVIGVAPDMGAHEAAGPLDPVDTLTVANDDVFEVKSDEQFAGSVAGNDSGGEPLNTWAVVQQPAQGTLVMQANGAFTYTPLAQGNGPDSFTYELCDDDNDCDTATVNFTVIREFPVPVADAFTMNSTQRLSVLLGSNDTLATGVHQFSLVGMPVTNPTGGHIVVNIANDGTLTVEAPAQPINGTRFEGTVTGQYRLCDAENDCAESTFTATVQPPPLPEIFDDGFED
jgi:hypothetical protein